MLKEPSIMPEFVQSPCPKPTFLMAGRGWNPGFSAFPGGGLPSPEPESDSPLKGFGAELPPCANGDWGCSRSPDPHNPSDCPLFRNMAVLPWNHAHLAGDLFPTPLQPGVVM